MKQNSDILKIKSVLSEEFSFNFNLQWNIPHASHQNGVLEALVKSVRQGLNSIYKNLAFTKEQWRTFLTEIGYMINSSHKYPSSANVWESPSVTPNGIMMRQHNPLPQPEPEDKVNPRLPLKSTQNIVKEFWKCWIKHFTPNLLPRNKLETFRTQLQTQEIPWKIVLVTDIYPGNDRLVRRVRIKTAKGEYDKSIHKLCVIATNQELSLGDI